MGCGPHSCVFFFIGFTSLESPCTLHFTQKQLAVCLNSLTTEHSGWDAWHAVKWSFSGAFVSVKTATALCANNNQERCIVHSALHRFSAPYCRVGFSAESRAWSICGIPAQAFVALGKKLPQCLFSFTVSPLGRKHSCSFIGTVNSSTTKCSYLFSDHGKVIQ